MNVNRRTIIGILGLIIISIAIFLGTYYNLIQPNHEGMMDMWAILLICIPAACRLSARYGTNRPSSLDRRTWQEEWNALLPNICQSVW